MHALPRLAHGGGRRGRAGVPVRRSRRPGRAPLGVRRRRRARRGRMGPRPGRAGPSGTNPLPARLRGPLPRLRQEPERSSRTSTRTSSPTRAGPPSRRSADGRRRRALLAGEQVCRARRELRYTLRPLMAVPKRKTSKARRDKRRAQHGIAAPRVNDVRELRLAEAVAPRVPDLQDVSRPRRPAAPNARTVARAARRASPSTPSGATMRRRRSSPARSTRASETPADPLRPRGRSTRTGLEHVRHDGIVEMDDKPAEAVRGKPDSSLVRAVRAVGDGEADAVVSAGNTGAVLAASAPPRAAPARACIDPGIAIVIPTAQGPSVLIDAGANADARPEHLAPVRPHGRRLRRGDPRACATPRFGCCRSARSPRRATS